jgi:tetratricopeptide (TPR) repeat protein
MPGVGKTSIGRHWAGLNKDRFTEGELSVDLSRHRSAAQLPPAGPASSSAVTGVAEQREERGVDVSGVLREFLEDLGVKGNALPAGLRERVELFRSLTTSRNLLVRVDDAFYPTEVSSLLPGGAGSMVIVTANRNVEELRHHAAGLVELKPLNEEAALELLTLVVGDGERIQAERSIVDRLVETCGGLPIALSVCGRWLAADRQRTVSRLVGRLTEKERRPQALSVPGDASLDRVFDLAYNDLTAFPALVYRRLGIYPGPDIEVRAAAILADVTVAEAESGLRGLWDRYLVEPSPSGRFQMHSRIREHSKKASQELDDFRTREQAMGRLVDWYYSAARRADRALNADRLRIAPDDERSSRDLPEFASAGDAIAWFDFEGANILAVLHAAHLREWDDRVWTVVEALWNFYSTRRPFADWKEAHALGIESARRCGNLAALAQMHKQASRAHTELREFDHAWRHLQKAADAVKASGNQALAASIVEFTGSYLMDSGDPKGALRKFRAARRMFERLGIARGVAIQDLLIGSAFIRIGSPKRGLRSLRAALGFMRGIDDVMLEVRTSLRLGEALYGAGRVGEAEAVANDALLLAERFYFNGEQAEAFELLARVAESSGDADTMQARWRRAHEIYGEIGDPRAADVAVILMRLERGLPLTG